MAAVHNKYKHSQRSLIIEETNKIFDLALVNQAHGGVLTPLINFDESTTIGALANPSVDSQEDLNLKH